MLGLRAGGVIGAVVAMLALAGGASSQGQTAITRCHPEVSRAVLPVWARGGFTGPRPRLPHVFGRSKQIVAILFGYPLRSPPEEGRNNKILWVSRTIPKAPAALWIRAQRMDSAHPVGAPVRRVLRGGPGPSIVDLPDAGCWRLTLSWSGRRDTLDLAYGSGS